MSNKSILIVENDPLNLKLLTDLLIMEGYHVHSARNTQEAFTILDSIHPDIILTDIQLPDIDGLELTRRLKADKHIKNIPILAMTAFAMKGDKERVIAAGCDGYISKPIDIEALLIVIESYLKSPLEM